MLVLLLALARGPVALLAAASVAVVVGIAMAIPPLMAHDGIDWDWLPDRAVEIPPEPGIANLRRLLAPDATDTAAPAQLQQLVRAIAVDRARGEEYGRGRLAGVPRRAPTCPRPRRGRRPHHRARSPTDPGDHVTDIPTAHRRATAVLDEVDTVIVGKRAATEVVLAGVLAGGHVLMEDFPGLGKTLAARTFAQALGLDFTRAQFTPDLLPADLTGSFVYDQGRGEFEFRKGPVFTGFLLADEINRTPPKTQAALLEAMQEHQVTVEGQTFALPQPFHVLATANPVEYEGTYPLPEAQLDRFLVRVAFGYPDAEGEWEVLGRRMSRRQEDQEVRRVIDAAELLELQATMEDVTVSPEVGRYCVALTRATRDHEHSLMGASPRGSLALMLVGRAYAVIRGRDYLTPDDVKAIAPAVLEHRVVVRPELWMSEISSRSIVADLLRTVPTPRTGVRTS